MKSLFSFVLIWALALAGQGRAQQLSGLAKFQPGQSEIVDAGSGVQIDLGITQAVPWRVRVLNDPARLVVDFREVDWTGLTEMPLVSNAVVALRAGVFRPGWSRLVIELSGPMQVSSAEMRTGRAVGVYLRLDPVSEAAFAALAALPEPADWTLPKAVELAAPEKKAGKLMVVLDPGHGGIDPGAESEGQNEKTLVLKFARELKEALLREGGFDVVMTRDEDVFVPLETRISIAHQAGADVFLSLHANAIAEGDAVGATVYSLSADASDAASAALAERHDRDDLLAGVDLTQADDLVAEVLMDMARTDTTPRTERLALALETAIKAQGLKMHRHPRQQASFSVLKSADIPSLLLELGFLSSASDLKRLDDPKWRAKMAQALVAAFKAWAKQDAGLRALPLK